MKLQRCMVSVPIRGLFNLTDLNNGLLNLDNYVSFRPHQGII